jgi:ribosomal-protein-alanine N-acetyltransferase
MEGEAARRLMPLEVLTTRRLRLRRYSPADEAALYEVFADPYARRFYPEMEDPANVRGWIQWNLRNYETYGFGLWAMERRESPVLIGDCGLTLQEVEGSKELEIGYHVVLRERGNGFASEAALACLEFGFQHTEWRSICSIVRPANEASRAVASRIHAGCREITRRGRPALLYYTTRAEWERRADAAAPSLPPRRADERRSKRRIS